MISVQYNEQSFCLTVSGHAGYGPRQQDIVCAGVSAICDALIGAVTDRCGRVLPLIMKRERDNSVRVRLQPEGERSRTAARLMLDMAYIGMEILERQFPAYVRCCRTKEEI